MSTNENVKIADAAESDRLRELYAFIWKSTATEEETNSHDFHSRIPRMMEWLRSLYAQGHLVACGGGAFENHGGGLTIIQADSVEKAIEIASGNPMNEIGHTEVLIWDVYYGHLNELRQEQNLAGNI